MLGLIVKNENSQEREVVANVDVLDITKLMKDALVPARAGDVVTEDVDGITKTVELTEDSAKGKKIPIGRYSVTIATNGKQFQFFMLANMLPTTVTDYAGKKANITLVKEVLKEERVNTSNPDIKHPAGTVFVNCVKLEFVSDNKEQMAIELFAKLMANIPKM